MKWIVQMRQDANTYAVILSHQKNGSEKVCACNDTDFHPAIKSTNYWDPEPLEINVSLVPEIIRKKIANHIQRRFDKNFNINNT